MDKVRILRELEYLSGGIDAIKTLSKNDEKYHMFDTWHNIIFNIIDMIEEDDENAEDS